MSKVLNLTGQKFGRWVVLKKAGKAKNNHILWTCRCDCGTEKAVRAQHLKRGNSKSCGCLLRTRGGKSVELQSMRYYDKRAQLEDNPSYMFSRLKKRAKRRKIIVEFTEEIWFEWYPVQERICHYCGRPIGRTYGKGSTVPSGLSIDRMDSYGPYSESNCVLCCTNCNIVKSNILTYEEMLEIGQKYMKPKWQLLNR